MKRKYFTPSISIVGFSAEDIVTSSVTTTNQQEVTDSVRENMSGNGSAQGEITTLKLVL